MTTPILFADVEEAVIEWLRPNLGGVKVYAQVPANTRDMVPFVRVERLGGPRINVAAEQATVTVEAWGKTNDWKGAHDLCQLARQQVWRLPGLIVAGCNFCGVREFAGPGRLADPVSGGPRFVFTVSLTVRPS